MQELVNSTDKRQPCSDTLPEGSKALLAAFWHRMTQAYGTVWINQYGEAPNRTWEHEIGKFNREELAEAIRFDQLRIKKRVDDGLSVYPPSCDEFLALCVSAREELERRKRYNVVKLEHDTGRRGEAAPVPPHEALPIIAKLKQQLGFDSQNQLDHIGHRG